MQLPPYSKNGANPHAGSVPRRTGSWQHMTPLGAVVRVETWLIPEVGTRWYVRGGLYLSPTGYNADSIDAASGFARPEDARAAADAWEAAKFGVVEPAPARTDVPALQTSVDESAASQGAAVLDASLRYRSRGETYQVEGWRQVETGLLSWTVRKGSGLYLKPPDVRGGSLRWELGMAGAVEFATPAEARSAVVDHIERDEAATAEARLREMADRVARGELFVRFQPADSTSDEVAVITRTYHQPGARTA
jgi:hypothetical protein